jgi:hypothetical protein
MRDKAKVRKKSRGEAPPPPYCANGAPSVAANATDLQLDVHRSWSITDWCKARDILGGNRYPANTWEQIMHHHIEGELTARDCKRHIPYCFVAPVGVEALEIELRFQPYRVNDINNMITLTVFDPSGFRGAGHRHGSTHLVRLEGATATPGYTPGPLPAGEWTVQLDTHMIMPGDPVRYTLDVHMILGDGQVAPRGEAARTARVVRQGPGWFRGDLHSHTVHSDASQSVNTLVQMAEQVGLDFIFLTDHNTTAGLAELDAVHSETLLTAGGIELTTFWGHALCLGTRRWVDWRVRPGAGAMAHIASEAYARDQVFIIAHPQAAGDPGCTGCTWRYNEMLPGTAKLVEIWNGPWNGDSNNEQALALWYDWLNQGLNLVATAGTDTHRAQDYATQPGFTVVYAEQLSERALLQALRQGHLYLSAGPQLSFTASTISGEQAMVGDTISQPAALTLTWTACPVGAQVHVIANGRRWMVWTAGCQGERTWPASPTQAAWCVVEIRSAGGDLLAITNPIFFA